MVRKKDIPKVAIDPCHMPYKWVEHLVENQKVGGVFYLFVEGDTQDEINQKIEKIKAFCNELRGSL